MGGSRAAVIEGQTHRRLKSDAKVEASAAEAFLQSANTTENILEVAETKSETEH